MRAALRNIILNAPAKPVFELALKASLVPEKALDGLPTFTRSSTATVMGYLEADNSGAILKLLTIPAGIARFTGARFIASNNTWSSFFADGVAIPEATLKGELYAGVRTNVFLQSNVLNTTPNASVGTGTTVKNAIGPDGLANSAWTITDTSATSNYWNSQNITPSTVLHTYSKYYKKTIGAQGSYPVHYLYATGLLAAVTVDTTNGIATIWTAATGYTMIGSQSVVVREENGYWRVCLTFMGMGSALSAGTVSAETTNPTKSSGTFIADNSLMGSCVVGNMQCEIGDFASSYISTTTAAVTRAADVLAYPAANLTTEKGAIKLEFTPEHAPTGTIALWGSYVDANNYTAILHDATNLIIRKRIAGTNYDATQALAFTAGTTYKIACAWGNSGLNISCNGSQGTAHVNSLPAQLSATLQIGADGAGAGQSYGEISAIKCYKKELKLSKLLALTV